jgi:predicted AlkP superfamily pyrophosphatase or phosphodiesterase
VNEALRETDEAMTRLVQGLKQRNLFDKINMIVLADHGMASNPLPNSVLIDRLIPLERCRR